MKSLYNFIIKPYNERYDNVRQVDDKELIINTGIERNSATFFKDELYFCSLEQIYMYNLKTHLDYCFVKPIKEINTLYNRKEKEHFGILKYSNKSLERVGLKPGDLVMFTPNSEFEFIIEGERLYCMKSNDIAVTHEYEGNEKENNPSWAKSS